MSAFDPKLTLSIPHGRSGRGAGAVWQWWALIKFVVRELACIAANSIRLCPLWVKSGQLKRLHPMSALPPKADIAERDRDVRFVPTGDILL
jgi:hypothetical protein